MGYTDDLTPALAADSRAREPQTRPSLLERLRRSDPIDQEAWGEFVATYGPKILAWCRRWRLQDADARDVTQMVLARLATRMGEFHYDPHRSFRAYLKTLTYFAWVDFVRDRKLAGRESAEELLENLEARDDLVRHLEQAHDRWVLAEAAERARLRVEPKSWEAFRLLAAEGLQGAEVARRLGMTVAAAFKARSRVQQLIQAEARSLDLR